jgi:hypothetical protein
LDVPTADFAMTPSTLFAEGDANLNGDINFDDLLTLAQNYGGSTAKLWTDGDFDFNGNVNFDDLLALAQNYEANPELVDATTFGFTFAVDWALAQSMVPEPLALSVVIVSSGLVRRRR